MAAKRKRGASAADDAEEKKKTEEEPRVISSMEEFREQVFKRGAAKRHTEMRMQFRALELSVILIPFADNVEQSLSPSSPSATRRVL